MEFKYQIRVRDRNGFSRVASKVSGFCEAMQKLRYFRLLNPTKIYWVEMYFES